MIDHFLTLEKEGSAEYMDRGSRFIAFAFPVPDETAVKNRIKALRAAHPKAVHHCFAYRLGPDGSRYRSSDDGEPSGSTGRPILGQIDSRQLTDTAVVVVRYFGGTLLGVPGLIQAYKTSTGLVLQTIPIIKKTIMYNIHLQLPYAKMNEVMRISKQSGAQVEILENGLFCRVRVQVPVTRREVLLFRFSELPDLMVLDP